MTMDLFVIIVNYNTSDLTFQCISSLLKTEKIINLQILIIDNASTEFELEKLFNKFSNFKKVKNNFVLFYESNKVILIKSQENLGYSRGNNLGLNFIYNNYRDKDYNIAIVNSDILFKEDNTFFRLLSLSQEKEKIALVMPLVFNIFHKIKIPGNQIQIRKKEKSFFDVLVNNSPIMRIIFFRRFNKNMCKKKFSIQNIVECEVVSGACFLMTTNLTKQKFLFDEGVFLYHEEYMLAQEIQKLGLKAIFNPRIKVEHFQGMSGEKIRGFSLIHYYYKINAQIYYLRKYLNINEFSIRIYKFFKIFEGIFFYIIINKNFVKIEIREFIQKTYKI